MPPTPPRRAAPSGVSRISRITKSRDYNPLNGGVARWFEPVAAGIGHGPSMLTILGFCRMLFDGLAPATRSWHIEVHQFRIEARPGEAGHPTPQGTHHDGVDYVLVLLIHRRTSRAARPRSTLWTAGSSAASP